MKSTLSVLLTISFCILTSCGPEAPEATTSSTPAAVTSQAPAVRTPPEAPATIVAELYKRHDAHESPLFQTKNRELLDRFFEKSLADLVWNDAVESAGEVGAIEFDPLYFAQDVEIRNFAINPAEISGSTSRVPVSFENFGKREQLGYSLTLSGDQWKISDITYSDGSSLRQLLVAAKDKTRT
jgi:hypothetical protein